MRIDAHQHYWLFDSERDAWINSDMEVIRRNFLPNDISQQLKDRGFDGVVAVQADQSHQETEFLVELASVYKLIKGVVGWVDLRSPEIETYLKHFGQYDVIKGFRHIIEGEEDSEFLVRDEFLRGIEALTANNFTYDLLIRPRHFMSTLACVAMNPNQKFMLDHIAKPDIRSGKVGDWFEFMEKLGAHENVYAKISGLATEADWKNWKLEDFGEYIAHVIRVFGKKRIVFGSDWPVSLLAANYDQVLKIAEASLFGFSEAERMAFFGQNAVDFYGLK